MRKSIDANPNGLMRMRMLAGALVGLMLGLSQASSATLWSIYWLSDELPCAGYWSHPMVSAGWPCSIGDVAVSICPRPHFSYPFDQGLPITIVGYEITHILTNPTAEGYMVVGSGHQEDGADVFAMTGGIGTTANTSFFPSGTGIPQGAIKTAPGYAHLDVYGTCDVGKQQALVNIFYTSP